MSVLSNITKDEAAGATDQFCFQLEAIIPSLQAFARRRCGNFEMAEDLVQETMMRALRAHGTFEPGTNFRAWMYMILQNCFYTTIRRNQRITSWDPEAAERILMQEPSQEHAFHLIDLEKALLQLPFEQREILLLVGANGATYEEAAEIVGCALGTVKSRVARGRTKLAAIIDGPEEVRDPDLAELISTASSAASPMSVNTTAFPIY